MGRIKERCDIDKHQVSFDKDRFVIPGVSSRLRIPVVCHCYHENDTVIRIISARKATGKEAGNYGY